ncbi:MAG: radical SAM protein [Defluviitaleaceae bacterium]|nr:radical SAM protein [Defluviitaleaceae bacterium]
MNKSADIKVGYSCNNYCIHCVISNQKIVSEEVYNKTDRSTDECLQIIKNSKENGCDTVIITGGEPTIRKDFFEIIKYAKTLDLCVCLQTNGRMFKKIEFAQETSKYVDYFTIALHGSNSAMHDAITKAPGSFEETLEGLKNLAVYTDKIFGKMVISKHNAKDLKNTIDLLNQINIRSANIAFPHANGNAAKDFEGVVPYYRDIKAEIIKCIEFAHKNNFNLELESILPCVFEKLYPVKYFADFYYTNDMAELNQLNEDNVIDWTNIRKNIKRKDEVCSSCVFDKLCEGYWMEYVQVRGFSEFAPITNKTEEACIT